VLIEEINEARELAAELRKYRAQINAADLLSGRAEASDERALSGPKQ
jgi:hypothetical protein